MSVSSKMNKISFKSFLLCLSNGCGKNVEGRLVTPVLQDFEVSSDHGLEDIWNDVAFTVLEELLLAEIGIHFCDLCEHLRQF